MGGASVVCFWETKSGSGEVVLGYCDDGNERVLKRRWQINLRRLDYLSAATFYEKGVRGEEMKRKLEREDFSKSWKTSFHLRGGSIGPVVKNQTEFSNISATTA